MGIFKFGDKVLNSDGALGVVTNEIDGLCFVAWTCYELDQGWYRESELTPATDWVKCSDRMPELGVPVLVIGDSTAWVDKAYDSDDGVSFYEDNYGRVTHWMPLPAPPTEVEQ